MHQDFVDDNTCASYVEKEHFCELFSFQFDLLIKPEKAWFGAEKKGEMDDSHRLVLSQDTKKLMLIINDDEFSIYTRKEPPKEKKVRWEPDP